MRHSIYAFGLLLAVAGCGAQADDASVAPDDGVEGGGAGLAVGTGGSSATGGAKGTGGAVGTGGAKGTGGAVGTGGVKGTGGATGAGGVTGTGGAHPANDAGPALTPGVWKDLTPPGVDLSGFGIAVFALDPGNPANVYVNPDAQGIWKTTDGGSTWALLGTKPASPDYTGIAAGRVSYLDCVVFLEIDPTDSQHIYAGAGTRGSTQGFWISTDGGATWTRPQGFTDMSATIGTSDMSTVRVDPTDFKHILLASHSTWKGTSSFGVLESKDGGTTWIPHWPDPSWGGGSMALNFLFNPSLGVGDSQTWLVTLDGIGGWRTTSSGTAWTKVPTLTGAAPHGGTTIYASPTGVLYAPATPYPLRSTDNGITWAKLTDGIGFAYYLGLWGDGSTLYTMRSFALTGKPYDDPYLTSPESDGTKWAPYQGGAQKFGNGPYTMRFDAINRIMYSANWGAGFWALKVLDP
jgi:hypothetical protein